MAARLLIALVSTLALLGGGYWWGHTATDNAWQAKHAKELEAERAETATETKRADQAAANYLQEHLDQEDRHAALSATYQDLRRRTPLVVSRPVVAHACGHSPGPEAPGPDERHAPANADRMPVHQTYCEVFAGAAWVLFKKPESKVEIINDINSDLTNLYRCVKFHLAELVAQFRWMLVSRDEFDRFLKTPADTLTDIQRAARFFYLAKSSFGARIVKPTYGISATGAPRLNLLRIEEDLSEAHLRLARVFIENKPYDQVIQRFDKPGTLFYVDPPYWDCENDYGAGLFRKEDFTRLAALLGAVKGKFLLSLNDTPGVREMFSAFHIEALKTRYSISGTKKQEAAEVLISNFR